MRYGLRLIIALLTASLLITAPVFAQTSSEPEIVNAKAEAEAKKKAEKEAEKKRKEEEKAAKEAAKKAPSKRNDDIENIGNRDINKGAGFRIMTPNLESEIALGRQLSRDIESAGHPASGSDRHRVRQSRRTEPG